MPSLFLPAVRGGSLRHILAFVLLSSAALNAYGNDSTGYVGVGGIRYTKNPDIAMHSEDLYLSPKQVRVRYVFRNLSTREVRESLLFPLPKIGRLDTLGDGDFADTEAVLKSFKVWVNGKPVATQMHVRAFAYPKGFAVDDNHPDAGAVDITAALKRCGLSDRELADPWHPGAQSLEIDRKITACRDPQLATLNLSPVYDGKVNWLSQVVYGWGQTFPAGQEVNVEHRYTPLLGGGAMYHADKDPDNEMAKTFCIDKEFRRKNAGRYGNYGAYTYILTTGANWARPIGRFHLTIERRPGQLVSLCWDKSLKKVSETRFEAVKTDFTPKRDIDILFANPLYKPSSD